MQDRVPIEECLRCLAKIGLAARWEPASLGQIRGKAQLAHEVHLPVLTAFKWDKQFCHRSAYVLDAVQEPLEASRDDFFPGHFGSVMLKDEVEDGKISTRAMPYSRVQIPLRVAEGKGNVLKAGSNISIESYGWLLVASLANQILSREEAFTALRQPR
jgi:hypothetical protein